ncbi:leucyl aminopeptidase family protein [Arthrobacter castelli]|uniref:leucyl aminopeptidase family protein n=1 Tax=Arthrobacter castelli TaxID=271431 RepID=UPI000564B156|nr:leucyl aminopeptidase family protein [Arthrobacter castelli]
MADTTRRTMERALLEPVMTELVPLPAAEFSDSLTGSAAGVDVLVVPIAAPRSDDASSNGTASNGGPGESATPQPRPTAVQAAIAYDVDVAAVAEIHEVSGKAGELLTLPAPRNSNDLPSKLLMLGIGDESLTSLRRAGAALARATFGAGTLRSSVVDGLTPEEQRAFVEGFLLGGYRPPRAGLSTPPKPMAARLQIIGADAGALQQAETAAQATWLSRSLANMPSNIKNPEWMVAQCERAAAQSGLDIRVWEDKQLREEGFGALNAVGAASPSGPRLVQLGYDGGSRDGGGNEERRSEGVNSEGANSDGDSSDTPHIVLVGKGVTFDSGGLSLKPREAMMPMKTDMAGAAVVLAVLQAAARLELPCRVTALLALAENSIGASSYRPGDVISAYGGTTIEVGNTDAEGRLVLADALAYASSQLNPDVLVDVATLTGAAAVGLGKNDAALYSNRDELTGAFQAAAEATGERVWPMPLSDEYTFALESPIADLTHIAARGTDIGGGSVFAALFLREFIGQTPWAHLDIAGPARADGDKHEITKGATGYGARLLLAFLADWSAPGE